LRLHPHARLRLTQGWARLNLAEILGYLEAGGLLQDAAGLRVSRRGGRNNTYEIGDIERGPLWFLKQFGRSDTELALFQRERHFAMQAGWPVVSPAWSDDVYRVILYPAVGESLWQALGESEAGNGLDADLASVLGEIASLPSQGDQSELPPIAQRMLNPTAGTLSPGQRRVVASLGSAGAPVEKALNLVLEAWTSITATTVHGDLKLEHVLRGKDGTIWLVDWEQVGLGPSLWDQAGLLQSIIAHALLTSRGWTKAHADIAGSLIEEEPLHLAHFVALRLWQTALEWTAGRLKPSIQTAAICQVGLSLVRDPSRLALLAQGGPGGPV